VGRERSREARNTATPISADLEPDLPSKRARSCARSNNRVRSGPKKVARLSQMAPPKQHLDTCSRDGVMRGVLAPTSTRRRVGIVASGGWSGWHAVAAGLGWGIAVVAAGDGALGTAWTNQLLKSNTHTVSHLDFLASCGDLTSTMGIEMLLFEDCFPPPVQQCSLSSVFPTGLVPQDVGLGACTLRGCCWGSWHGWLLGPRQIFSSAS
jgi:hypothetical protein